MCGRTACTLAPDQICQACCYPAKNSSGKKVFTCPDWKDHPGKYTYCPSTNIAPSKFTPVLLKSTADSSSSGRETDDDEKQKSTKYIVQPMKWGLIPHFFKGESAKEFGFKTSNCRVEDIHTKKSYQPSLKKGQRCVILCEGFYEWQTTKGDKNKQPYFIHAPQKDNIEIWNKKNWETDDLWSEEEGWKGANLLKIAGLYSRWKSSEGEEIWSYSAVTIEADKSFRWLHHRVPAILETNEDVENWLEEENSVIAISRLKSNTAVSSYPVSTSVNNSRNQDPNLHSPAATQEEKASNSASSKFMSAWLNSSSGKGSTESSGNGSTDSSVKTERTDRKRKENPQSEGIKKWLKKD